MKAKNKFRHNKDGTTTIFLESKKYGLLETLVDAKSWQEEKLWDHRWYAHRWYANVKKFYVTTNTPPHGSKLRLHRVVMSTPKGLQTDHINGDTLDNRKSNLRVCTSAENQRNRGKQRNNKSGFKGVYQEMSNGRRRLRGEIKFNGEKIRKHGKSKEALARWYDKKKIELEGVPANPELSLNFPEKLNEYLKELNNES